MPPRKKPKTLFECATKATIVFISIASRRIQRDCRDFDNESCQKEVMAFRNYLISMLPARIFEVLCSERSSKQLFYSDPRIQLSLTTHPNMTSFHKCDLDNSIPMYFWLDYLPPLTKLTTLDLKLICTDEILEVVCSNCPLLEEVNAVSKVDLRRSPFNASVLSRNVSDKGILHLVKLKNLRIVSIDNPRNGKFLVRVGRWISQNGIRSMVSQMPSLEELRVESCDIGSTLITGDIQHSLNLKKIHCHFASPDSVNRLMALCPHLRDLSLTHLASCNKDQVLQEISLSDVRLSRLELSFFAFSPAMEELLKIKGSYLSHLSLFENDNTFTMDKFVTIGKYCPSLVMLRVVTQSELLVLPPLYRSSHGPIFRDLKSLTLGCDDFVIENVLMFFLSNARNLSRLILKYNTKICVDETFLKLSQAGLLSNLDFLWLDCTLMVSNSTIKQIIDKSPLLKKFVVLYVDDEKLLQKHISDNNYDIVLDNNY